MTTVFRLLTALTVAACLISCGRAGSSRARSMPEQDYDAWQNQEFTCAGFRLDVPAKPFHIITGGIEPSVSIQLHAIPPPPGVLDDATVLVHISVKKITLDELAEQKADYLDSGLYKTGTEDGRRLFLWDFDLHPETSRHDNGRYSYYNRDVKVGDKEILHAHAEVLNAPIPGGMDKDHAAVRRILDSIEPLK